MSKANSITLEYEDGEQVTAHPKVRHLIAAEEKFGQNANGTPPIKGTLYAAWLALDKPMGRFGVWVDRVDSIVMNDDDEDEDEGGARPTKAAGSVDG